MRYKEIYIFCLFVLCSALSGGAQDRHTIPVETKEWYRDSLHNIQYKDWKTYDCTVVDSLKGFRKGKPVKLDKYGGLTNIVSKATGYFRVEKIKGRSWIIDPLGHQFINVAVNTVRPGKSPNNNTALGNKYGTNEQWLSKTKLLFDSLGINVAGSWSDVKLIQDYNKTALRPLVYTTQLSLLANYRRHAVKIKPERKKESEMSFILDKEFSSFTEKELEKINAYSEDSNLLGHFSDNEIPFTENEVTNLLSAPKESASYGIIRDWLKTKGFDESNLTKEQKQELIGFVTEKYFSIVGTFIKKVDPNHLYIGSRLHASAKNNPFIFKAADPYIDIISINYYGFWQPKQSHLDDWTKWSNKPFFITEFYTKAVESGMANITGAGWLVKTHNDRGLHYQNFCLTLLKAKNCVGWHWFKYQDNDPEDPNADPSNKDSNKGLVDNAYNTCYPLAEKMKEVNDNKYSLIKYFDSLKK